jgi:tight adherence protein C
VSGAIGAAIGLLAGSGAALAWSRLPLLRRPTLAARVEPYIRDVIGPGWPEPTTLRPLTTLGRIAAPALDRAARRLGDLLGGSASVRRRLEASGSDRSIQAFRTEQVIWGACGFGVGGVLGLLLLTNGAAVRAVALIALCAVGLIGGVLARDVALSRAVRRHEQRILAELPVIAELLALAVAAGEGPSAALERVARSTRGALAGEIRRALAAVRAGTPLAQALDDMARRTSIGPLARFADGFVVALERGTPLSDVLRAQADDVREAGRRALIEAGGRKEIAMLLPGVTLS